MLISPELVHIILLQGLQMYNYILIQTLFAHTRQRDNYHWQHACQQASTFSFLCLQQLSITYYIEESINYQPVPTNNARRAIQTFKSHFISDHSIGTNFPLQLWDPLHPQAEDSLNMLCEQSIQISMQNPPRKAQFQCTAILAPFGCKSM